MKKALDRIDASLAGLRTWAEEGKLLPFIDEGHDFAVGPPMEEAGCWNGCARDRAAHPEYG
jgi:hypothetical protein